MASGRPLRGGCHCGRNRYLVQLPGDGSGHDAARVLFSSGSSHRIAQASPLAAHIRVPLEWYRSTTFAFFPDETSAMIRRAYASPHEQHTLRHFCGFCGTPLTYWSEEPRAEADYIQLTLGSLCSEDLGDLQDLGLLPEPDGPGPANAASEQEPATTVGGLPWFDSLVEGSRLADNVKATRGAGQSRDGRVRIEWEIVEYTDDDGGDATPQSGKRKLDDRDAELPGAGPMEDVHSEA